MERLTQLETNIMRMQWPRTVARAVLLASTIFGPVVWSQADETVRGRSIDTWLRILQDRSSADRDLALEALSEIGGKDPRVVPALAAAATDPAYGSYAITALGNLGPSAHQAEPVLKAIMLQHPAPEMRMVAADALWQISKRAECLDVLIHSLDAPITEHRAWAAEALGGIGPPAPFQAELKPSAHGLILLNMGPGQL